MVQKVEVDAVDALRRRLAVEIPAEAVSAELEKTYAQLARSARVPGFRRGRVPRQMLERMFGDRVRAEVHERLIQQSYAEAVQAEKLPVVGHPEIATEHAEPGDALRYSATVEVKPDVEVQRYEGIAAERPFVEVTEADVDAFLDRLRESAAHLHPVEGRETIAAGDVVTLSYEARVNERLVGRADQREVEIGRNGFPSGFDEQMIGTSIGRPLSFDLSYPSDHPAQELAGQTVRFVVQPSALASKEIPGLDDDFAKAHGDCDTVAELRVKVRTQLDAEADARRADAVRQAVLAGLSEANDIPVPQALIAHRLDSLVEDVWREWQQQRVKPKNESAARERLRSDLEPRAREQVKLSLLLEAIARQEGLSVGDDEVDARIGALVERAGDSGERLRALYEEPRARRQLQGSMLQGLAVDLVVARANVRNALPSDQIADPVGNG
jgi:trigger factor